MMLNTQIWDALKRPPSSALREIKGGRLNGKTDINPQWRMQVMTERFGPAGVGWKYSVERLWLEPAAEGQVAAFAQINLSYRNPDTGDWSDPIPGIGGSMFIEAEKNGLHVSDEAYKMAITDALSVAMKALGVAADIYAGLWDGSKYRDIPGNAPQSPQNAPKAPAVAEHAPAVNATPSDATGVNAGIQDKAPLRLYGIMYSPAVRAEIMVKGTPTETADCIFQHGTDGPKYKCKAWGHAADDALAAPAGAQIEIEGTWHVWKDTVSINVKKLVVMEVPEGPVPQNDNSDLPF